MNPPKLFGGFVMYGCNYFINIYVFVVVNQ